ncbi:MAG: hypothetical protein HY231_09485 [Acidobacteria bacterium]|nr:hypothetical protein [Acidobacteriota bacterium]
MKIYQRIVTLTAMLGLLVLPTLARMGFDKNEFLSKPFSQWTKSEATKILNDSPWALIQEERSFGVINSQFPNDFKFTLRLRSALPVRQALMRMKQLEANYDKMSASDKTAFDAKNKGTLDCPACAQNYVVTLSSSSESQRDFDWVFRTYRSATLESVQNYIFLAVDKGEKRSLVHFIPSKAIGGEAMFFFPRFDDKGSPLVTPNNKKLRFQISSSDGSLSKNFEFDVAKLLLNGEVAF